MDTSNNPKDFCIIDLLQSAFEEDKQLAEKAIHTLREIVGNLKPVLPYITNPLMVYKGGFYDICEIDGKSVVTISCYSGEYLPSAEIRGIKLATFETGRGCKDKYHLFINEKIFFITRMDDKSGTLYDLYCQSEFIHNSSGSLLSFKSSGTWERVPFGELLQSLKDIFDKAVKKREQNLKAVRKRSDMLDRVLNVIQDS